MRRALSWLGLLLLAVSFIWLMRLPAPLPSQATAPRRPLLGTEKKLVVVLDPGHGGQDSGAMCGSVAEKDLTLDVALRAELLLRAAGFRTVLTRDSDRYVSLADRASLGNQKDRSLFVSIHFNDSQREAASGVETYFAPGQPAPSGFLSWLPFLQPADSGSLRAESESLAASLQGALVERTSAVDRGIKSEQFYVIANVRHPAVLVEAGFMTNKADANKLATVPYRQQLAAAIAQGVERYRATLGKGEATLAVAGARPE
jgi:N-acetylmuramoyl-L-alanine amidase